ncbi:hypothetical protein CDL60_14385 [Roseateles noduli]|nr:hypothetical protein CDL60_14385 [Roseateles noduli]
MSLAALRSLFTSCVAPGDAKDSDPLHRQRQARLGPVVFHFFGEGSRLLTDLHRQDVRAVLSTPDLVRSSRSGGGPAHRARTPSTGKPLDIVAVPHHEAALARHHADKGVHVLPVHGDVPEPQDLLALIERLDGIQDLHGSGLMHSRVTPRCPTSLAAACSAAMVIRDAVRDAKRGLPRDDREIVRAACMRLPMDARTCLRAEEIAALLAFTFYCKTQYLSPKLGSDTVRRPGPSSYDDGGTRVHWNPSIGTRRSTSP